MLNLMSPVILVLFLAGAANAQTFGDWQVTIKRDQVTLKTEAWASTKAKIGKTKYGEQPIMGINCENVYFGNVAVLNTGNVTWRFDNKNKAENLSGSEWQGSGGTSISFRQALGTSDGNKAFRYFKTYFKDFVSANKLYVEFDTYADSNVQVTFSMRGATAAINKLQAGCWGGRLELAIKSAEFLMDRLELKWALEDDPGNRRLKKKLEKFTDEISEKRFGYDTLD